MRVNLNSKHTAHDIQLYYLQECVSDLAGIIYKKVENLVVVQNSTEHIILTSWNAFSVWTCGLENNVCTEPAYEYYKKWRNGEK